jgi:orotidine-5'-phosphate decarboxylase
LGRTRPAAIWFDGVVAAAADTRDIKTQIGDDFVVVTPGIRPSGEPVHEQKEAATPCDAARAGADYLVVGRPITLADRKLDALNKILNDVACASSESAERERAGVSPSMSEHAVSF